MARGGGEPAVNVASWTDYWSSGCGLFLDQHCTPALRSSFRLPAAAAPLSTVDDFSQLHDAFLDSLLAEQKALLLRPSASGDSSSVSTLNSWNWSPTASSSTSYSTTASSIDSGTVSAGRKRRRGTLRHMPSSTLVDFNTVNSTKSPAEFMEENCRLQKDKNRGEPIGSAVCAYTIQECLTKLRAKMSLLTEHCGGGASSSSSSSNTTTTTTPSATMKRRNAILVGETETRSLLTLRMGFVSMTYGILLRWNVSTGKICLVVLRKNVHQSFYSLSPPKGNSRNRKQQQKRSLEPPHKIARPPADFGSSELRISVIHGTGLSRKSSWTISLKLGGKQENVLLVYDRHTDMFLPKVGSPMVYHPQHDNELLEIQLLEHRRTSKLLRCTMRVPTGSLEPQNSLDYVPTALRIPCPNHAVLFLEAVHLSDSGGWEEPAPSRHVHHSSSCSEPYYESGIWDWLCMICV